MYDLLVALLRDQNIHDGYWGLSVQFEANSAAIPASGRAVEKLRGLAIGVSGVTLITATEGEARALDASLVNPLKQSHARSSKKAARTLL
ncbi:hypothetical protein JJQ97_09020 [Pseudomonas syringae]|uniref:hypothetical protein n=1 Tax=Pseudomonas syringae TaxID=317 RepID=UPI0019171618|nr:hypothetical protein [Pseudomonas syringae]QQQ52334.1 hypothetical protein JJQ97_09020 [Pseudomonas syringae]